MSQSGSESSETITAEFRDGQLQIVEVSSYDRSEGDNENEMILPDMEPSSSQLQKKHYMQVVDTGGKGVMHLNLLNFTLIKCQGDENSEPQYKLVANDSAEVNEINSSDSVACVLQSSDCEEQEGQDAYVMVEGSEGPVILLQSSPEKTEKVLEEKPQQKPKQIPPAELIERAKLLQKAKALTEVSRRGRKRTCGALPPPHELLASPNFKLFLYSCKFCNFKCNAIKELTEHRQKEHGNGSSKWRLSTGSTVRGTTMMQCAKCPYRGATYGQFMKHLRETHLSSPPGKPAAASSSSSSSTSSTAAATVVAVPQHILVCGACGFESSSRDDFHRHVNEEHPDEDA